MIKAKIFNIQRFCVNDGPGIRTTVFLKGCALKCAWCHNPESRSFESELMFSERLCLMCRACEAVCQNGVHGFSEGSHSIDREKCLLCGKCEELCPSESLEIAGKEMTVEEVLEKVLRDKEFYKNSGGGMTLSGGEPLCHYDFSYCLVKAAKEHGIHTCIETSGFVLKDKLLEIAEYTDLFLYDWKITDEELHKKYTGVSNVAIKENLLALDASGKDIILRCPVIPSVNDTQGHFEGIAEIANTLQNIKAVEIEPYHSLGVSKSQRLGKSGVYTFHEPDADSVKKYMDFIQPTVPEK